jgi:hypothetical protein
VSLSSVTEVKAAYAAQLGAVSTSDWDALCAALDAVDASGSPGQWNAAVERADGSSRMAFPSLSAEAQVLMHAFTQAGMQIAFDSMTWPRGKTLAADPSLLAKATPAEAAMVIVAQIRADRFVDGHLLGCFSSGLIQSCVERILTARPTKV